VWQTLRARAGLAPGLRILEIGAGTGLATTRLLAHRPAQLVAIEPDPRLADFLRTTIADPCLQVIATPFEQLERSAPFDLVASATAFHWLDAIPALRRIAALLREGAAVAIWWNVFGDDSRPDPFHEATARLFADQRASVSRGIVGRPPHALDAEMRLADFTEAGFVADEPIFARWTLPLDPQGVRNLYNTYSNVTALPQAERERFLDDLQDIAGRQFGGRVTRNMTTAVYVARLPR
jgi:SAM-dependent methyltransferase